MSSDWQTPAGWYPDPRRRFEQRYWSGSAWTDHVASGGVTSTDPVDAPAAPVVSAAATAGSRPGMVAAPGFGTRPGATAGAAAWPAVRIVAMVGAGLLALGSLLPWAEVHVAFFSLSVKGTDGDGKITLALGIVTLVLLAVAGGAAVGRWLAVAGAGVAGAVALYDLVDLQ